MILHHFHTPIAISNYSFFSIGKGDSYFEDTTATIDLTLAASLKSLQALVKKATISKEQTALVLSGLFIEQLIKSKNNNLINSIKVAINKKKIVLFASTYHNSIASIFSLALFKKELTSHHVLVKKVFGYTTTTVYNTLAIYFDELADVYAELGFSSAVAPTSEWHLNGRAATTLYQSKNSQIKLILLGEAAFIQVNGTHRLSQMDSKNVSIASVLSTKTDEKYLAPQPIIERQLTKADSIWDNPLQKSVISKIVSIEKKLLIGNKTKLIGQLAAFTSIDCFTLLTPNYDHEMRPYNHYISLMNILSDFEITVKF